MLKQLIWTWGLGKEGSVNNFLDCTKISAASTQQPLPVFSSRKVNLVTHTEDRANRKHKDSQNLFENSSSNSFSLGKGLLVNALKCSILCSLFFQKLRCASQCSRFDNRITLKPVFNIIYTIKQTTANWNLCLGSIPSDIPVVVFQNSGGFFFLFPFPFNPPHPHPHPNP